jgi:dUTP pyrophosphatase
MNIKIKKLHPSATTPTYGSAGAACFDLYSSKSGEVGAYSSSSFNTSISFEIPANHVMLVFSRSGHGFKQGVSLVNSVGVIDADYRGEVIVGLKNDSALRFDVNAGDRIAQALILPVKQVVFEDVQELSTTERGVAGFGSTGF